MNDDHTENYDRGDLSGIVYDINGDMVSVRLQDGRNIPGARLVTTPSGLLKIDATGLPVRHFSNEPPPLTPGEMRSLIKNPPKQLEPATDWGVGFTGTKYTNAEYPIDVDAVEELDTEVYERVQAMYPDLKLTDEQAQRVYERLTRLDGGPHQIDDMRPDSVGNAFDARLLGCGCLVGTVCNNVACPHRAKIT